MAKHLDAISHRKGGGFALAGSSLTGNTWDGALWLFNDWDHYINSPNIELEAFSTITGHNDIAWLNQSKLLVAADSGDIEIWDVIAPGNMLSCDSALYGGHDDMVLTVCAPKMKEDEEGESVVSGGGDGRIVVWDVNTAKAVYKYRAHVGWITDIDYHPSQSNVFISTGLDQTLRIWDTRQSSPVTMSLKGKLKPECRHIIELIQHNYTVLRTAPHHASCLCVSWSKYEDNFIASGDEAGYLYLHDLRLPVNPTASPFYYRLHSNSVHCLSFCPIVKGLVASVSDDSTAKLFHFPTQTTVFTSSSHADFVHGLSWQPDSTSFLTCSWDFKVYRHEFNETMIPDPATPSVVPLTVSEMQDESLFQDFVDEDFVQEADVAKGREGEREGKRDSMEGTDCNGMMDESLGLNGKEGQAALNTNGGTMHSDVGLAK